MKNDIHDSIDITRKEFEDLSKDLLHRINFNVRKVWHESRVEKIDQVVYIGGSAKMPMIKRALNKIFSDSEHYYGADSEYATAVGACVHALQLCQDNE